MRTKLLKVATTISEIEVTEAENAVQKLPIESYIELPAQNFRIYKIGTIKNGSFRHSK